MSEDDVAGRLAYLESQVLDLNELPAKLDLAREAIGIIRRVLLDLVPAGTDEYEADLARLDALESLLL